MSKRHPNFHKWNVSENQILVLWIICKIPKFRNLGIEVRKASIFPTSYRDESNFKKAIDSLIDKGLIEKKKKEKKGKGKKIIKKFFYYPTKKGRMFLKII